MTLYCILFIIYTYTKNFLGTGLRPNILNTCHYLLHILSPNTKKSKYIDSLNVNAATAILLHGFFSSKI